MSVSSPINIFLIRILEDLPFTPFKLSNETIKYFGNWEELKMKKVIFLITIFMLLTLSSNAFAGSKWFQTSGFPLGSNCIATVTTGDTNCLTASNASYNNGIVTYLVACNNGNCNTNVRIKVECDGVSKTLLVDFECVVCGANTYPSEVACIPDICTAGGNTEGDALDVTACAYDPPPVPSLSTYGIILLFVLLIISTVYVIRKKSPGAVNL